MAMWQAGRESFGTGEADRHVPFPTFFSPEEVFEVLLSSNESLKPTWSNPTNEGFDLHLNSPLGGDVSWLAILHNPGG